MNERTNEPTARDEWRTEGEWSDVMNEIVVFSAAESASTDEWVVAISIR